MAQTHSPFFEASVATRQLFENSSSSLLPLAMALPLAKYARGDDKDHSETILDEHAKHAEGSATEHSETIIDARGLATQPSDEGKPARIPIIQAAFKN